MNPAADSIALWTILAKAWGIDEYDLVKDHIASDVLEVMANGQKKLSDAIYGHMDGDGIVSYPRCDDGEA